KGLFDLLGIEWLVVQEKEYKTAFESFVRDRMSPQMREVLDSLLDQSYGALVDAIARGRSLPAERVRAAIDEALISPAHARELGLIDRVAYRDQFLEEVGKDLGGPVQVKADYGREGKELDLSNPFALFAQIAKALSGAETHRKDSTPKIAVV